MPDQIKGELMIRIKPTQSIDLRGRMDRKKESTVGIGKRAEDDGDLALGLRRRRKGLEIGFCNASRKTMRPHIPTRSRCLDRKETGQLKPQFLPVNLTVAMRSGPELAWKRKIKAKNTNNQINEEGWRVEWRGEIDRSVCIGKAKASRARGKMAYRSSSRNGAGNLLVVNGGITGHHLLPFLSTSLPFELFCAGLSLIKTHLPRTWL